MRKCANPSIYTRNKGFSKNANVDDLSDTGTTFKLIRVLFPKATLAAVYAKPVGLNYVDIYSLDIPDKWIVFPWDI